MIFAMSSMLRAIWFGFGGCPDRAACIKIYWPITVDITVLSADLYDLPNQGARLSGTDRCSTKI